MSMKNGHIAAVLTAFARATAVPWGKVLPAVAVMGAVTLISGCVTESQGKPTAKLGENAQQALTDIFQKKDPHAVDHWFDKSLVQHDPLLADGLEGERAFARDVASSPNASITIYRTLVDGDLVLTHSRYEGLKDRPTLIAFDLFRFKHGKIVEHWGGQEPLAKPNASGHTQFDGAGSLKTRFKSVLDAGPGSAKPKTGPVLQPRRYVAEGNFVLALVDANTVEAHTANYDLFRVENGKIIEHWDVLSVIPPPEQRKNGNDPF